MSKIKLFFKDKTNVIALVLGLLAAYLLFPGLLVNTVYPIDAANFSMGSLDASWSEALNYVNSKGLIWGTDFAFTYGPLAYLSIRLGLGANKYSFLVYDIFFALNVFFMFFFSYKQSTHKPLTLLFAVCLFLILPGYMGGGSALVLYFILIFWAGLYISRPHYGYLVPQILLVVLLFYTKFNSGLVAIIIYFAGLWYAGFVFKQKWFKVLAYTVIPVVLIIALTSVYNVYLPGFISAALEIVAGYTEIMYLEAESGTLLYPLLFALMAGIFFGVYFIKYKPQRLQTAMYAFLFFSGFYIMYKQAYTRADVWHVNEFLEYALLLMFCVPGFSKIKVKDFALSGLVFLMMGGIVYANFDHNPDKAIALGSKFNKSTYIEGFKTFDATQGGMGYLPNNNQMPDRIKQQIGTATVDSYPWNTAMLMENSLNYLPRPVMQSYTAYTHGLEQMNFDFYNSAKGPEYVVYDYDAVDNRYAFFDEPKLNLVLLKNYTAIDTFDLNSRHMLLLEKKPGARPVQLTLVNEYAMDIDDPLLPRPGIFYEIGVYSTLKGKAINFLTHAPWIYLRVVTQDNSAVEFKTSAGLLHAGVFSDTYIKDTRDFYKVITNAEPDKAMKVKQYNLIAHKEGAYLEKIRVKEFKVE
jgi:hypothetical protein